MQNETRRIFDALPGLVWSALPDGQLDFLNRRWCEYTGLSLEEACGQGWQVAVHPEDLPELLGRGAVECLLKPFSDIALLEALNAALRVS